MFDKFRDSLSSPNIFVTFDQRITGYSCQPENSTVLSQKQNLTVTHQKIVKDYFSSIHYLTPNLVINLYLTNSIIQL